SGATSGARPTCQESDPARLPWLQRCGRPDLPAELGPHGRERTRPRAHRGGAVQRGQSVKRVIAASLVAAAAALVVGMTAGDGTRPAAAAQNILNGPSAAVGIHAYVTRPERAPAELRAEFAAAREAVAHGGHGSGGGPRGRNGVFNDDTAGLPQNE